MLGAELPAPAAGAVDVVPGDDDSQVVVSVVHAVPVANDFLASRRERVPGADGSRRIVRLKCDVSLEVRLRANQTRDDRLKAFDAALFFIEDPAFRSGRTLDGGDPDPGFFLHQLTLRSCDPPTVLNLDAEGFFWPVGSTGQTGEPIVGVRLRVASEPLLLEPTAPLLIAGGPQVALTVRMGSKGAMDVREGSVARQPFGQLVLRLTDAGGRAGAGTLTGGDAGPNGSRRITFSNGSAPFPGPPLRARPRSTSSTSRSKTARVGRAVESDKSRCAYKRRVMPTAIARERLDISRDGLLVRAPAPGLVLPIEWAAVAGVTDVEITQATVRLIAASAEETFPDVPVSSEGNHRVATVPPGRSVS